MPDEGWMWLAIALGTLVLIAVLWWAMHSALRRWRPDRFK
jgi:hypothetical protein